MKDNKKILIVGDVMLDSYRFGDVNRISPEAPVPVFLEKGLEKHTPGGAGNVAVNVAAIGIPVDLFSVVGKDECGKVLISRLKEAGINTEYVIEMDSYTTISKLRYIGPSNQQILRVDKENTSPIPNEYFKDTIERIEKNCDEYGILLISDYMKGLLSKDITQRLIRVANEHNIMILIDVKDKDISKYKNATLLKPNRKELAELTGYKIETISDAIIAATELCKMDSCKYVMATLGADGMILVNSDGLVSATKSSASEVYDVTGAGDTSIAYLAAEIIKGESIENAMIIANYAAGVQVSKAGTSVVWPNEVYEGLKKDNLEENNILDAYNEDGLKTVDWLKLQGKKIVFTNGCFDILHVGHTSYLREARKLGDVLIVGVNSDSSVQKLKGTGRPINSIKDRMMVLSSLEYVDYVVEFREETPLRLIEQIKPDVLVKGGDYQKDQIVGYDFVKSYGGVVETIPFLEGKSTTSIVEKMRKG